MMDMADGHWQLVLDEWERLQAKYPVPLRAWTIERSARLKSTLGMAYTGTRTIRIAEWLLKQGPVSQIIDTVRHEAAHAWHPDHSAKWRSRARVLGALPKATASIRNESDGWVGHCPDCGATVGYWGARPRSTRYHNRDGCKHPLNYRRQTG
jgi:hypothetical protein